MYFSISHALQHGISSHRMADGVNFTPNPNRKDVTQLDNNAAAFAVNEAENYGKHPFCSATLFSFVYSPLIVFSPLLTR